MTSYIFAWWRIMRSMYVLSYDDRNAGFTLNSTKMTIAAREVTYLGHCLSSRGICLASQWQPSRNFLAPPIFDPWDELLGWRFFMLLLCLIFLNGLPLFMLLIKRALNIYGQRSIKQRSNPWSRPCMKPLYYKSYTLERNSCWWLMPATTPSLRC